MLQVTVDDILNGDRNKLDPTDEPFCIYVIRDGSTVLYIGKSNDPFARLQAHFGKSWHGSGGSIGPFYEQHKDKAGDWQIDLYTLVECEHVVLQVFSCTAETYRNPHFHDAMVSRAEIAMIRHYRPCLNGTYNENASPLPEKYAGPKIESVFEIKDGRAVLRSQFSSLLTT